MARRGDMAVWSAPLLGLLALGAMELRDRAEQAEAPVRYNSGESVWSLEHEPAATGPLVYYHRCDDARAAGQAPLYRGDPGYRPGLDRDGDGVACEPYRGW